MGRQRASYAPARDRRVDREARVTVVGRVLPPLVGAAMLLAGCGGATGSDALVGDDRSASVDLSGYSPAPDKPALPDRAGLQDALDTLAAAFASGDRAGVAAWLFDPTSDFGQRWQDRASWMTGLPLASYALALDETFADLASDALHRELPGSQVVYVVEETELSGFDLPGRPARDDLFLTVVDTPEGWRVVGDDGADRLGFVSVDHLWDLGPVTTTRLEGVGAIHHPDMVGVQQLLEEAQRALATAQARWPLPFPPVVPILVPRNEAELAELLHATFDLSNFVAFATATSLAEQTTYELTGSRIVLNPDRFLRRTTATRELILVHEFVHVATHAVAGLVVPNWLDEGVAQAVGERRSSTGTALLSQGVANGYDGVLPTDFQFRLGGQSRVFLSYQQAWSFVDHLVRSFGAEAVADFYAKAGAGSVGMAGSASWLLDRAATDAFGRSLEELRQAWLADLR